MKRVCCFFLGILFSTVSLVQVCGASMKTDNSVAITEVTEADERTPSEPEDIVQLDEYKEQLDKAEIQPDAEHLQSPNDTTSDYKIESEDIVSDNSDFDEFATGLRYMSEERWDAYNSTLFQYSNSVSQ